MTIDREELRRMCEAATPGPWQLETVKTSIGTCHKIGKFPSRGAHGETSACVYADSIREHDIGHSKVGDELLANARLIAAARTAVPALLDAQEAADAREKRLRSLLLKAATYVELTYNEEAGEEAAEAKRDLDEINAALAETAP